MANKKYFTDESLATLVDEIQAYANGSAATKADAALTSAKSYTDEKISTFVGDTPVATQISNATTNYYTKAQIDAYEFITIADIDEICGNIEFNDSLPQSDIDELMSQLQ